MKKYFKLFYRDFKDVHTTIGLKEYALFGKMNKFHTWEDAENFINANSNRFSYQDEITILPVWTLDEEITEFNRVAI